MWQFLREMESTIQFQILDEVIYVSLRANSREKAINQSVLLLTIGKY